MTKSFYVYLDVSNNAVTFRGVDGKLFLNSTQHYPENLLFLDDHETFGKFYSSLGLHYTEGKEDTLNFLKQPQVTPTKWIDFNNIKMLSELNANELSELLYLGHTSKNLHSPFFYKLQNNFVYFDLPNDFLKIYFRYANDFYRVLTNRLTQLAFEQINQKKSFFQKKTPVENAPMPLLKEIRDLMTQGVVFEPLENKGLDDTCSIAIYTIEDNYYKMDQKDYHFDDLTATFVYNMKTKEWHIELPSK